MKAYLVERYIGIFLCIMAILIYINIPSQIAHIPRVRTLGERPSFFPTVTVFLLFFLSILLIIYTFTGAAKGKNKYYSLNINYEMIVLAIVLTLYYTLFFRLGFFLNSVWFLFFLMYFFGYRKWPVLIALSLLIPYGIQYFFMEIANFYLPKGKFLWW